AGGGVHTGEPAALLDVRGQPPPSGRGEDLAAGGEEDDGGVPVERRLEGRGVLGGVDVEAEAAQGGDTGRDGVVPVVRGAGVDEKRECGHAPEATAPPARRRTPATGPRDRSDGRTPRRGAPTVPVPRSRPS